MSLWRLRDPNIVCSLRVLVTSVLEIIPVVQLFALCCADDDRVNSGALTLEKECGSCSYSLDHRYCSGMGRHESKARSTCTCSPGRGIYRVHLAKTRCGVLTAPGQESKTSATETDPDTGMNEASKPCDPLPFSPPLKAVLCCTGRPVRKNRGKHEDPLSLMPVPFVNLTSFEIGRLHVGYGCL